jgi:hypothetical protein
MNVGEGDIKSGWLFSSDFYQNRTPSRLDGISASEETLLRAKSILFIEELGVEMRWYVVRFLCKCTLLFRVETGTKSMKLIGCITRRQVIRTHISRINYEKFQKIQSQSTVT